MLEPPLASTYNFSRTVRNLVGMSTLALLLTVVIRIAVGASEWVVTSLLAFAVTAPTAWFTWQEDSKSPQGIGGWLLMAFGSIALGGIFLLIDGSIGLARNSSASLWNAATSTGSPFGFVATVSVCPGFTCICIAGAARAAYARRKPGR